MRAFYILFSITLFSKEIFALDCAPADKQKQIEKSTDVFVGRVIHKDESKRVFDIEVISTLKGNAKGRVQVQYSVWGINPSGEVLGEKVLFAVQKTSEPHIFSLSDCDGLFAPDDATKQKPRPKNK